MVDAATAHGLAAHAGVHAGEVELEGEEGQRDRGRS
jgi:hypothetical protein